MLKNVISRLVAYKSWPRGFRIWHVYRYCPYLAFMFLEWTLDAFSPSIIWRRRPKLPSPYTHIHIQYNMVVLIGRQQHQPFLYLRELAINCSKSVVMARVVAYICGSFTKRFIKEHVIIAGFACNWKNLWETFKKCP